MATTGHESEAINVQGMKASLQKLKTDIIDPKYAKPSGGIPKTDMTSDVQTSLGKADTALQSHQSKSDIGLGNVTNDAQVKRTEMGAANGVATLGSDGKVPSSQLPSYVDDVLEYDKKADFPATGESGKIYVNKANNTTWRWSGTTYSQIKGDLVIGTTEGTAADGKTVNDHINNTSNPHGVTKSQVGLGNVGNFKAVSTEASQGLSTTEQSNARANIGAGTSSFSGNYNNLSNKPTLGSAAAKDVPSSGNASSSQVVMGNDSRLSDSRAANGGNADTIDSYHIAVVSSMPSSPNKNTIYIVK